MSPSARRAYEWFVALVLGATIFTFVCGSSAVIPVLNASRPIRWGMFGGLTVLAVAYAAAWGSRLPLLRVAAPLGAALVALAAVSTAWSVDPRITFGRAGAVGLLFAAATALASGAAGRPESVRTLLVGLVGGATAVAFAGIVVLVFSHAEAVQPASTQYGSRYRGLGQNPNTVAALLSVIVPANVALLLRARSRGGRAAALTVLLFLDGSMVASGSRGAMVAAFAGTIVVAAAARAPRPRAVLVGAAVVVFVLNLALTQLSAPKTAEAKVEVPADTRDAEKILPLESEIGRGRLDRPAPRIHRTLFGASGRGQAWGGAIEQVAARPIAGYGFGTESRVFVDRYFYFSSASPENSYLAILLQLGAVGGLVLLALLASVLAALWKALAAGTEPLLAAAGAGGFVAGLVLAVVQSYLLSLGNVATASVWICACLACAQIAGTALLRRPSRVTTASVPKTR
jgi:O-antigen ligase